MLRLLFLAGMILLVLGGLGFLVSSRFRAYWRDSSRRAGKQWPTLVETHDRNEAHMIKALLDDANVPSLVEEDRTMGVLYGLPGITQCMVRVPPDRYNEARGHLKESSFEGKLPESNEEP